jgi:hypothetical protein
LIPASTGKKTAMRAAEAADVALPIAEEGAEVVVEAGHAGSEKQKKKNKLIHEYLLLSPHSPQLPDRL